MYSMVMTDVCLRFVTLFRKLPYCLLCSVFCHVADLLAFTFSSDTGNGPPDRIQRNIISSF